MEKTFNNLNEILEKALRWEELSTYYFELMNKEHVGGNKDMEENYWGACQEVEGRAHGLLDAYEIINGRRHIVCTKYSIIEEMERLESICIV